MLRDDFKKVLAMIDLIVIDVDGTLTDGSMYFSAEGEMMKRFSVRDGMGITLAHKAGIEIAFMTSETSEIVVRRAEKLKVRHLIMGSHSKELHVRELADKIGTVLERVAFIGDDVNDETAMRAVGFSACPADATEYMKSLASYVCVHNGGDGAVREVIDAILNARGAALSLKEHW